MCRKNRESTSFSTIPPSLLDEVKLAAETEGITIRQVFDDAITRMVDISRDASFDDWIPGRKPDNDSKPYNVRLSTDVRDRMATALEETRVARDTFVVTALTRYVRHQ